MYDIQRTGTLGITKFSRRDELKFKHLYELVERRLMGMKKRGKK